MMSLDIEAICRKLKPILKNKADELYYMWLAADFQERKELEIEIQLIAEKVLKHGPLQDRVILLPPPSEEDAKGDFVLGNVIYRDKKLFPLYLTEKDLIRQIFIGGISGGGKTNVSLLLLLQMLLKKPPLKWLAIDWKRQYRSLYSLGHKFPEVKEIILFTAGRMELPFLFNPFRPPPGIDYKTWIPVVVECLEKSYLAGLGVGDIVSNIFTKLFENMENDFFPNFYDGLRELNKMKVSGRQYLWWQSTKRIFSSLTTGDACSKCFNSRKPIKLEELLEKNVIIELDQSMPRPQRILLMDLIFRFIFLYRLSQGDSDELRHLLVLEECQNLLESTKYEKEKIQSLEQIARQIRSTGEGVLYSTQHISTSPTFLTGNVHTLILLAQQHQDDIEAARKATFLPREDEAYFNMLKTGQGIVKVMERINPCLVQFLYVPVKKGMITDEWLKINMGGYSKPASDAEEAENRGYSQGDNKEDEKKEYPALEERFLADIYLNPLSSVTQRYKRIGVYLQAGNQCKNNLIERGFIVQKKIVMRTGWITLFELTEKGRMALRDLGYEAKEQNETVEHYFWKSEISGFYKNKGFDVLVEEFVNGRPDIIVIGNNKKVAVEIERDSAQAIKNIEKNLKKGFDEIACVAVNKEVEAKIIKDFNQANDKVKIISVFSFDI